MKVLAIQLYHAQLSDAELPPKSGDNRADIPVKVTECQLIQDDDAVLIISPECREGLEKDNREEAMTSLSEPFLAAYPPGHSGEVR